MLADKLKKKLTTIITCVDRVTGMSEGSITTEARDRRENLIDLLGYMHNTLNELENEVFPFDDQMSLSDYTNYDDAINFYQRKSQELLGS